MITNEQRALLLAELASQGVAKTRKSVSAIAGIQVLKDNSVYLNEIEKTITPSPINGYASLVNFTPTSDQPIHRWFRYREGYSTGLVKEFIKDLPRGSIILDPFCGAGTTLLAAREAGLPSIGLDVNPISTLVSRVKTTSFDNKNMSKLESELALLNKVDFTYEVDPKPQFKIIDKVFDQDILTALLIFPESNKKNWR